MRQAEFKSKWGPDDRAPQWNHLIPGLKLVPRLYDWRIRSRIYRWYGVLIGLERGMLAQRGPEEPGEMLERLDEIESAVNRMKVPLAFADQFSVLRDHIGFVRVRYTRSGGGTESLSPDHHRQWPCPEWCPRTLNPGGRG
jgi:hypothetical protein